MKLEGTHIIEVTLSRRNLKTLLLKLDQPASRKTLVREMEDGRLLVVRAEEDNTHYQDREPGPVHPREEAKL